MSELDLLRESLRSVQQERDRYRSETARLRTENAKLHNDIDLLYTRLSDLDGAQARVRSAAVDVIAQSGVSGVDDEATEVSGDAGFEQASVSTTSKRARSPLIGEGSHNAKKSRVDSNKAGTRTAASSKAQRRFSSRTKNDGIPVSGANAAPLNEAAGARFQKLTGAAAVGTQTNGGAQMQTGLDHLAPIVGSTPVAGPSQQSRSYKFYDKIPAQCLTLPLQKLVAYLNEAVCAPLTDPISPVEISRYFISQNTFSNRGGVAKLRFPTRTECRHILISTHSAYFPIVFGSPGFFMSCWKQLLSADSASRLWTCLAWTPSPTSKSAMYMGEYRLRSVGVMAVEDYQDQKEQAKTQIASLLASSQNPKKGEMKTKSFFEDACKVSAEAFASGEEKINIFLLEFVQYDTDFARSLREKYESWKAEQGHTEKVDPSVIYL